MPLGINLRHGSLIKKKVWAQKKIQNGRQKKQNGRQKYSFSQLSPRQLTNMIYSKNKKTLSTLPEHFEKKIIKIG